MRPGQHHAQWVCVFTHKNISAILAGMRELLGDFKKLQRRKKAKIVDSVDIVLILFLP